MPVTINGTTGVTTPGATVGAITGILKATSGVVSQAVAGTDYLTSTSGGSITLGTPQTATGTAVDFTGIPSWVKRITVMLNQVTYSAIDLLTIRLGTSSGIEATNYIGSYTLVTPANGYSVDSLTTGFGAQCGGWTSIASFTFTLVSSNTWLCNGISARTRPDGAYISGVKSLTGVLDRIRITTSSGATFTGGTINISYE